MMSWRWGGPRARKVYFAYSVDELRGELTPFSLMEDGYTIVLGGFRYTVKKIKDGEFVIFRDFATLEDYEYDGIVRREKRTEKGEGLGSHPATFEYCRDYFKSPIVEDDEVSL
jgi:hypothetical protein